MEYMAPEMLQGGHAKRGGRRGHGPEVDWWALGCLVHEMTLGEPPFVAAGDAKLRQKITGEKLKLPVWVKGATRAFITELLHKDPAQRLGAPDADAASKAAAAAGGATSPHGPAVAGAAAVRAHPYFAGIDWTAVRARRVASPWADRDRKGGGKKKRGGGAVSKAPPPPRDHESTDSSADSSGTRAHPTPACPSEKTADPFSGFSYVRPSALHSLHGVGSPDNAASAACDVPLRQAAECRPSLELPNSPSGVGRGRGVPRGEFPAY